MATPRRKPTSRALIRRAPVRAGPERRKAVLYARVSTPEQEREGFSIPSQLKTLKEYAAANDITVAGEYIDVETAKRSGRAEFEEMLRYLRKHTAVRIVLVEKTDRLYRNLKDWVTVDGFDIEIHFVKENVVLSSDSRSSEKFMHGIKVLMAKNYIDNLSEETRKGMLEKARQGIWPSFAPIGYINVIGPAGKKVIAIDPEMGPLVSRLFEWFGTGMYSVKDLTAKARLAGLRYRKSGKPLGGSTIHKILRNRLYTGSFEWLGTLHKGSHEPLTSLEIWENTQEILDGRSYSNTQVNIMEFPFTGMVTCGHCGCALVAEIKKRKYIYYHCTSYRGKCPERYVRQEVLEERFAAQLRRLHIDDAVFELMRRAIRESHSDECKERHEAIARLRAETDRLQTRLEILYIDKVDGRVTGEFHDRMASQWREERTRCLSDIDGLHTAEDSLVDDGIAMLDLGRNAHREFSKQPIVEKKKLLNLLLSNCKWANDELTVSFTQPFDILVKNRVEVPPEGGRRNPVKTPK